MSRRRGAPRAPSPAADCEFVSSYGLNAASYYKVALSQDLRQEQEQQRLTSMRAVRALRLR